MSRSSDRTRKGEQEVKKEKRKKEKHEGKKKIGTKEYWKTKRDVNKYGLVKQVKKRKRM